MWRKTKQGTDQTYLRVRLDDPAWPQPIWGVLHREQRGRRGAPDLAPRHARGRLGPCGVMASTPRRHACERVRPSTAPQSSLVDHDQSPLLPTNAATKRDDTSRATSLARVVVLVLLPFVSGYYLSYLYRSINALISEALVAEFALSPGNLGFLTATYFLAFAVDPAPPRRLARPLRSAPRPGRPAVHRGCWCCALCLRGWVCRPRHRPRAHRPRRRRRPDGRPQGHRAVVPGRAHRAGQRLVHHAGRAGRRHRHGAGRDRARPCGLARRVRRPRRRDGRFSAADPARRAGAATEQRCESRDWWTEHHRRLPRPALLAPGSAVGKLHRLRLGAARPVGRAMARRRRRLRAPRGRRATSLSWRSR